MVKITESLIRKKSEHNELVITTLEELSLHQEDIEKIEHIQNWCRDLKILLFQSNLISKIENVNKLKKLEYLNLAINNIERVENLEGLESLKKLDLTLNFIGEIESIKSLRGLYNLQELFLTGNPCAEFNNYRDYVVATLPQLQYLDGQEVTSFEKISAKKRLSEIKPGIKKCQKEYGKFRVEQKLRVKKELARMEKELELITDEEERVKWFWNCKSENCPETRIQIAGFRKKKGGSEKGVSSEVDPNRESRLTLFAPDGRPFNINRAKLKFNLIDEPSHYELILEVPKFLDTSAIDIDLQPTYIRVTVKGKIFQLALRDEVSIEKSSSKRAAITGQLLITMPKVRGEISLSGQATYNKPEEYSYKRVKRKSAMENLEEFSLEKMEVDFNFDCLPTLV